MTSSFLKNKLQKGFTLLETLFAVLIFSAALVSLMTIAGRGISASNIAREQVVAYYLAQEGLEVARNIRDSNLLQGLYWSQGLEACPPDDPCNIEYVSGGAPGLESGDLAMYQDADGFFTEPGEATQFTRAIVLEPYQDHEYLVTATVSWNAKGIDRSVVLKTILKSWYGAPI